MKRLSKRVFFLLLAVLLTFAAAVPALADDDEGIDVAQKGSISVDIKAYATDAPVSGGSLDLYYIADVAVVDGEVVYQYRGGFSECDPDLLDPDVIPQANTAERFADWVSEHKPKTLDTREVDSSGEAVFSDLSVGLYLVTQHRAADGYDAIKPFLVTIPLKDDNITTWHYDVNASPKTSPVKRLCTVTIGCEDYEDGASLSGAQFSLQDSEGSYAVAADTGAAALCASLSGVSLSSAGSGVWSNAVTTFTIPDAGLTFYDLAEGDYVLTQVTANDGYILPDESTHFTVGSDGLITIASAPRYNGESLVTVSGVAGDETIMIRSVSEKTASGISGTGGDSDMSQSGRTKTGDYDLYLYGVLIVGAALVIVCVLAAKRRAKRAGE